MTLPFPARRRALVYLASAAAFGPAGAQTTVEPLRIAFIEGLSGPFANAGEAVFRNLQWAVERHGSSVVPVRMDVTNPLDVAAFAATHDVDLLVSNAGREGSGTVIGHDPAEDARRFHVSPKGVVLVTRDMLGAAASA